MTTDDRQLPSGTVTLLFTDIEGSTRMLQELGREAYVRALTAHRRLLRQAFTSHGGIEVEMQGDSFHFAFPYARDAVAAAVAGQRALAEHAWEAEPIKVRIGLHTGEPMQADGLFAGLDVHHAARVMSAAHGGQVLLSARTAELVQGELTDGIPLLDLGEHRLKDLTAPQRLLQAGEGDFPPLKTLAPQSNLPVAASPLIGRDEELARLTDLLTNGARAVTVTGPGGAGKTRLALQAAAELVDAFPDGVHWIPLAGLAEASLVVPAIAQALGVPESPSRPLADKRALLLLDNFEHLLAASATLAQLLAEAPGVTALVTSRAPLHIAGEQEFPLDPLATVDGVTLFVERARAAGRALQPDDSVAEICRRLDNLPLAIELAATRTKLLSPEALLGRLNQRLPLLTGGRRDAPEHQRTLTATIAWSFELLDPDARQLFARLSVFAGSFALEAAEEICAADLDTIAALADLSLLKPAGDNRLLMLETIREFARNALEETGEAEVLRRRHADWYLNLALEAARFMYGAAEAQWFEQLEADHDNLRGALETLLQLEEPRLTLQLVAALHRFWSIRGFAAEGLAWVGRALAASAEMQTAERAAVLETGQGLARDARDFGRASGFAGERLAYARTVGDARAIASALSGIAVEAQFVGDFARARDLLGEAMAALRESGDDDVLAFVLNELGFVAYAEKDFTGAGVRYSEVLALARELGDEVLIQAGTGNLAMVLIEQGRHSEAIPLVEESLQRAKRLGHGFGVAGAIDQTAMLAVLEGDARAGALLMGAAANVWQELGADIDFAFHHLRDRVWATCRAALDDAAFDQAYEQGRALSRNGAVAEAERRLSALRPLHHDHSLNIGTL